MFILQQMQQAGQVAPTPTVKAPMIAAGPAPVQVQPAKELQIEQPQQTEADKFKSAAKMAALNAGMSNAFKAGATKAAMTNPMAAPLAVASMFLKKGDKVPDYEQQTVQLDGPFDPMGPKPEGMTDDEWNWWRWSEPVEEIPFSDDDRWNYNVQLDGPFDPMGPKPPGLSDDEWEWWRWSEPVEETPFSDDDREFYSKGNKVKKPGYYNEGEEVQGGNPWWRLGPLARLFGKSTEPKGRGIMKPPVTSGAGDVAQWRLNKIVKEHNTPSTFMEDFEKKLAKMSKEERKRFWANYDKLGRQGQIDYLNAREADFNHELKNRKMKEYVNSLESEKKLRREFEKHGSKKPFKVSDLKPWDMDQIKKDSEQFNKALDELEKDIKNGKPFKPNGFKGEMSSPKYQLFTEDGTPVKGSDLMSKDLENYNSKWNKFKRGITAIPKIAKFAAPLAGGPFTLPLTAAGTLLDVGPLSNYKIDHDNDFTPHVEPPIFSQEERDYMRKRQLWDQVHQEQQNQIRNDFAPFEEKEPVVYKQHGGAALDNAIDYFNNWKTQGQSSMMPDQPYFQNISSSSDDNSSFTDQAMSGNVNLWGPLSLDWNHGFGGQVGVGMDVPLMGGRPQWQ